MFGCIAILYVRMANYLILGRLCRQYNDYYEEFGNQTKMVGVRNHYYREKLNRNYWN